MHKLKCRPLFSVFHLGSFVVAERGFAVVGLRVVTNQEANPAYVSRHSDLCILFPTLCYKYIYSIHPRSIQFFGFHPARNDASDV